MSLGCSRLQCAANRFDGMGAFSTGYQDVTTTYKQVKWSDLCRNTDSVGGVGWVQWMSVQ